MGKTVDGGMLISDEALMRLGNGDPKYGRKLLRMFMADEQEPKRHIGPTAAPPNVRYATEEDEFGILTLLLEDISRSVPKSVPIDEEVILDHVQRGTRAKGGIVGVIDGPEGFPIAATVIMMAQSAYSRMYYLQEIFNVVHRDFRRSNFGQQLIDYGCWCSDEMTRKFGYQVPIVSPVNTMDRVREKIRFYRRHMTQVGANFIYPTPLGM